MKLKNLFALALIITLMTNPVFSMKRCQDDQYGPGPKRQRTQVSTNQTATTEQIFALLDTDQFFENTGLIPDITQLIMKEITIQRLAEQIDCSDATNFRDSLMALTSNTTSSWLISSAILHALQLRNKSLFTQGQCYEKIALLFACENGHTDMATAILKTAHAHNPKILKQLLLMQNNYCKTLLNMVCCYCNTDIVKAVFKACSPEILHQLLLIPEDDGETPLHLACRRNCIDTVKAILEACSPEILQQLLLMQNNSGNTLLHLACCYSDTDIVKATLEACSSKTLHQLLLMQDYDGYTPLHLVCLRNRTDTIKAILEACTPETLQQLLLSQDNDGYTPLHAAQQNENKECTDLLIAAHNKSLGS